MASTVCRRCRSQQGPRPRPPKRDGGSSCAHTTRPRTRRHASGGLSPRKNGHLPIDRACTLSRHRGESAATAMDAEVGGLSSRRDRDRSDVAMAMARSAGARDETQSSGTGQHRVQITAPREPRLRGREVGADAADASYSRFRHGRSQLGRRATTPVGPFQRTFRTMGIQLCLRVRTFCITQVVRRDRPPGTDREKVILFSRSAFCR